MSKRRRKRKQRQRRTTASRTGESAAGTQTAAEKRAPIVPWRQRVRSLMDTARQYAREHHSDSAEAVARAQLGDPETAHPADIMRLLDDLICTPGAAGDGRSIVAACADAAEGLEALDRDQLRRWESERGRGVFIVQRCFPDRIEVFDPLEGAGLTLHLLNRLGAGRAAEVTPGTVVTATYVPYVARVVAVGVVEIFTEHAAIEMFRREVQASGAAWHEPPPPPPMASK